ncbi:MAG: membrane dipeptidase, partial [Gemmatimonadetes bacterium]|nr:membrane dipeptidase [Gemmatimonadota bacterium]
MLKRLLLGFVVVLVVGGLIGWRLAPGIADRMMNKRTGAPPWGVSARAESLTRAIGPIDLHNDVLLWGRDITSRSEHGHVDLPRLEAGHFALAVFSTVTKTPKGINYVRNDSSSDQIRLLGQVSGWPASAITYRVRRALLQAQRLHDAVATTGGRLILVTSVEKLDSLLAVRARGSTSVGALLSTEGLHALDGQAANLDTLFAHGFRAAGITHFFDNDLGGSAHGVDKGGLTPLGRAVVQRMEQLGMVVDVAHASPTVVSEVFAMATKPVIVSHGGVQATCAGPRNLSDDQLRALAKTGGVIGIGYWDGAICDPTPANAAKAIRHVADVVGVDHVALGSDWDGATSEPFDASGISLVTDAL